MAIVAFTNTTTNVTPQTAVIPASGNSVLFGTWLTPSETQVKPPNGHAPRIQSRTVQAAAIASASTIGLFGRRTSTATAPNAAIAAADRSTSAVHASSPNSRIQ